MRTPYPEFVLTNIICIEKALKGTEIVFVITRFYCNRLIQPGNNGGAMECVDFLFLGRSNAPAPPKITQAQIQTKIHSSAPIYKPPVAIVTELPLQENVNHTSNR